MLQGFDRGDAQDVAFQFARQVVVLEHDVERLIPRHVIEHDRQRAVHVGIEHDVQSADFVNEAEEIFQVNIFQVDRDRLARILRAGSGGLLSGLRLLLRRQIHCGREWPLRWALRLGCMHAHRKHSAAVLSENRAAASCARTVGSSAASSVASACIRSWPDRKARRIRSRLGEASPSQRACAGVAISAPSAVHHAGEKATWAGCRRSSTRPRRFGLVLGGCLASRVGVQRQHQLAPGPGVSS